SADCPAGQVAEFDANGQPVSGFGVSGVACIDFPNFGDAADIAVQQADDRILVLGRNLAPGGINHLALARLDPRGRTVNQIIQPLSSDFEHGDEMAIQADGRVVVVGDTTTTPTTGVPVPVLPPTQPPQPHFAYSDSLSSVVDEHGVVLSRYLGDTLAL